MMKKIGLIITCTFTTGLITLRAWSEPQLGFRRDGDKLTFNLSAIDYPQDFEKNLKSGLTSLLLIQAKLKAQDGTVAAQESYSVSVNYDLWDEVFRIKLKTGFKPEETVQAKSISEALARLTNLNLPTQVPLSRLQASKNYVTEIQMLLNPIEKERVQKIRQWVSQNSVNTRTDVGSFASSPQSTPTRFNEIFASIFAQYTEGKSQISLWQRQVSRTGPLLKDLKEVEK